MSETLPNNWINVNLRDIAMFQEGPGLRKWQFGDSGIPFLNIKTLKNESIDKSMCQFVKHDEFTNKYEHFLLNTGDIVVSISGTLGKVAVVKKEDLPVMLNTSVIRFRSHNENILTQLFLKHFLKSNFFFSQIQTLKTGSAILNYGPSHLKMMSFPLPPLNEQKRIVAKLDAIIPRIDSLKTRLDKIPALIKRFRQSVLTAAVAGKLTEMWREECRIDGEWASNTLETVIKEGPQNGLYKSQDFYGNGVMILRIDNFYNGYVNSWNTLKRLELTKSEQRTYKLMNDDIVINRVNSMPFLGKSALVRSLEELCVFESNMMRIRVDTSKIIPEFLIRYLNCQVGLAELRKNAKHAVNQSSINQQDVKAVIIPLPPLDEQKEIVRQVDNLFTLADKLETHYQNAKARIDKLSQSVLAKAFRGELVPQDPNDEPAEKLLERIMAEKAKVESALKGSKKKGGGQKAKAGSRK
ncbi:MAG: restriction endonuclease subunit S [Desulfobacterales bacterium]|nr:restriction endonuclease subunit S [Desulfitobacteriaceae bacterium]MDD4073745.1 restriction endonuclease subunit S [Desulfobacterales bacterium]MDD4402504.1 restriction endonuclease subunit S [Desulfitobacteriaceae bacterium]